MPQTLSRPVRQSSRVRPSIIDPAKAESFTLEQELEPFGRWLSEPIWAPPKDSSAAMAESMLRITQPFTSRAKRWEAVVEEHRSEFTQVREIELFRDSIRLPKGNFFVSVTEQQDFDQITDKVPACVQTRLEEFLAGPSNQRGVKVYYLKPLCVDFCDDLIMTTREDVTTAITRIQEEVFAEYTHQAAVERTMQALRSIAKLALALPRALVNSYVDRKQKTIDAYQARLEFQRRKIALGAARTHRKCRTDGCTFEEMLDLTTPLAREAVVHQYCEEQEVSRQERINLMRMAAGTVPWFMLLTLSTSSASAAYLTFAIPPLVVCDPAFVAEMPDKPGELLKIGHFDDVDGVTHVEI